MEGPLGLKIPSPERAFISKTGRLRLVEVDKQFYKESPSMLKLIRFSWKRKFSPIAVVTHGINHFLINPTISKCLVG